MTSQDLRLADYSATDTGIYYLLSSDTMHFPLFPVLSAPSANHREQAVHRAWEMIAIPCLGIT